MTPQEVKLQKKLTALNAIRKIYDPRNKNVGYSPYSSDGSWGEQRDNMIERIIKNLEKDLKVEKVKKDKEGEPGIFIDVADCHQQLFPIKLPSSLHGNVELPYIEGTVSIFRDKKYNPKYGDDRICECGHSYERHFDSYEDMNPVGCKYCQCFEFKEKTV
jgi:hypothetical protein